MIRLVYNECIKLAYRVGTWVMVGILILGVITMFIFDYKTKADSEISEEVWKTNLQEEIKQYQEYLDEFGSDHIIESFIRENEYRIENDLPPTDALPTSVWTFISGNQNLILLVGVFVIVVSATIISTEFKQGTIKLLLIRPPSRLAILVSKYITVILYSLFLLSILFISSFILGSIFFGFEEKYSNVILLNGELYEQSPIISLIITYLSNSINFVMLVTLAFAISSIFRSDTIAIALSLIGYIMGATATGILTIFYDWPKYILFTNTNLSQYFSSTGPPVEGMTIGFSIVILVIYWVLFLGIAAILFQKKEIKTG
ncbi:ABC transporter permease [Alkalicoccobacillus murimartini]|uniref:ABC-2 type transport system permease protein n=1 Tax=Alkalicoccobacillus murimartini TaxID=171685 RepID=A0ABT9YC74_9BACI|nr:ABC transporter permease subunit [Alkalicoccobacillus murimartini]MDQ0205445.1 ABC-2 type transport system permease protein [Alkalicoccobacillus murimartini]